MTNQSYLYNGHMLSHKRKQAKENKERKYEDDTKGILGSPPLNSLPFSLFISLSHQEKQADSPLLHHLYKGLPFSFSFHNSRIKPLEKITYSLILF